MALRKRTVRERSATNASRATAPQSDPSATNALALRHDKILLTLAIQSQQINDRLTRLEDRFDAIVRDSAAQPDQQDLLELRLHSARLAAELSRVSIELRAEINELRATRDPIIDLTILDNVVPIDEIDSSTHPSASNAPHRRVDDLVAEARDAEARETEVRDAASRMRARRTSGWKPSREPGPRNDDR